jgi:CheY-like chemotaxis protein
MISPTISTDIKRFLIIDDDPVNNMICRMTIEALLGPVECLSFQNPAEGFEYIVSSYPLHDDPSLTVLLLDINMPVMTGWEFLDRFDSLSPAIKDSIRIYVLSSSVDGRDRERSYANKNVRDFLVKPLMTETVLQMVT